MIIKILLSSLLLLTIALLSTTLCSTCSEYFGGQWYIHWYNCCDNCEDDDPYCDGFTWQGGSNVQYCGSCGENSFGGKFLKQYDCVNCDVQSNCTELVNKFNYPGLCWVWSKAFRGCCKKASYSNIASGYEVRKGSFVFCGDRICQDEENLQNCPLDCCPMVNANCTSSSSTKCLSKCCDESTCCLS